RSVSGFSLPPCRRGPPSGFSLPPCGGGSGWGVGPIPAPRRRHRWSCLRLTLASLGLARRKSAPAPAAAAAATLLIRRQRPPTLCDDVLARRLGPRRGRDNPRQPARTRSEEHTSELQSLR